MLIAKNKKEELSFDLSMANRHGLIAGATGTGKTVTLKVLAEIFNSNGVPVFLSDVKGDLSGFSEPNRVSEKLKKRIDTVGFDNIEFDTFPVAFWDIAGKSGHPLKTTISQMGPMLLAKILELNETQFQVLSIVFKIADDEGLLLLDLKDLKAILNFVSENTQILRENYGNISVASIGAITRALIILENEGGDKFFGEPALDINDLIQTDGKKGVINILNAQSIINSPKIYSTFLLWLLSELFENLPEVGDVSKPKFVFFFDESHLLFENVPDVLVQKIEQVARLIRSKGVGIYFITQSPDDIPENILGQLGNKFLHALRAFTPNDQKAIKAAAQSFRTEQNQDLSHDITTLEVGEALISTLSEDGSPNFTKRAFITIPKSSFSPISSDKISNIIQNSALFGIYEKEIDRESAYESLKNRTAFENLENTTERKTQETSELGKIFGAFASSAARAIGSQVGRQIIRGILGVIVKNTQRR
jgi:DNA helicase HerA-like ATPase